jgi:hypothetical protein
METEESCETLVFNPISKRVIARKYLSTGLFDTASIQRVKELTLSIPFELLSIAISCSCNYICIVFIVCSVSFIVCVVFL